MRIAYYKSVLFAALALAAMPATAQLCPEKNLFYWQAFAPGGETDLAARHQQIVLKKKCPTIETVMQYKPGAGGGLMWSQINGLPPDGLNVVGINLPHIVHKSTGDLMPAVIGQHVTGAMSYSAFAINTKEKICALAVAMDKRHPLLPDTPTFKELGIDWVDGAYRGIGMPKSAAPEVRKRVSDLWASLNGDAEMKELAAKSGFELVNIGVDRMDAFMKERTKSYMEVAKLMGLAK